MMDMMMTVMSPSMTSVIMMTDPSLLTLMHHLHILMLMNHMHISLCKRARERVRGTEGGLHLALGWMFEKPHAFGFPASKAAITGKTVMIGRWHGSGLL